MVGNAKKALCIGAILVIVICGLIQASYSCNEQMCASIVSKCMLTRSCNCELTNCTCCKECFSCLNYLFSECCSCVDMCPKQNETVRSNTTSLVEDMDGIPGLFSALTIEPDDKLRWVAYTYPVDYAEASFKDKIPISFSVIDQHIDHIPQANVVTVNCTVAYLSQCLSLGKCRNHCSAMGASYMRYNNCIRNVLLCSQIHTLIPPNG